MHRLSSRAPRGAFDAPGPDDPRRSRRIPIRARVPWVAPVYVVLLLSTRPVAAEPSRCPASDPLGAVEAACRASSLPAADTVGPRTAAALGALEHACEVLSGTRTDVDGQIPVLLAADPELRERLLSRLREVRAVGERPWPAIGESAVEALQLLPIIERSLPDAPAFEGGYVQNEIIRRSLATLCGDSDVAAHLPNVCAQATGDTLGDRPLSRLRALLLLDAAALPASLARRAQQRAGPRRDALTSRLTFYLAALEVLQSGFSSQQLVRALQHLGAAADRELDLCAALPEQSAEVLRAAKLLHHLLMDVQALASRHPQDSSSLERLALPLFMSAYAALEDDAARRKRRAELGAQAATLEDRFEAAERAQALLQRRLEAATDAQLWARLEAELAAAREATAALHADLTEQARQLLKRSLPRLSNARREAGRALVRRLHALVQLEQAYRTRPPDAALLRQVAELLSALIGDLLAVLDDGATSPQDEGVGGEVLSAVSLALTGDLSEARQATARWLQSDGASPETVRRVQALFDLARADDTDDVTRVARAYLVDLGPWADHVVLDASLGAVRLSDADGDYRIAADATIGYAPDALGVVARGAVSSFTATGDGRFVDTDRFATRIEAWWVSRPSTLRLEARTGYEAEWFDTTLAQLGDMPDPTAPPFFDETRWFNRGLLLLSLRVEPSPRFGLLAGGGGGFQVESYNSLRAGAMGAFILDEDRVSAAAEGRLRVQWLVWPQRLALRARADLLWSGFSEDTLVLTGDATGVREEVAREAGHRVMILARGFVDLEALAFAGFVPSAAGGIDLHSISLGGVTARAVVPVLQVAIRRVAY